MQLTPYAKLLVMSKEAIDKAIAPIRASTQKKKAELEVLKLEEQIATYEQSIIELCSKQDLNYTAILDKIDELELAKLRKNQFSKLISQLFPDKE